MWQGFSLSLNTVQFSTPSKVNLCIFANLEQKGKKEIILKDKMNKKQVRTTNNPQNPKSKQANWFWPQFSVVENVEDKDPN